LTEGSPSAGAGAIKAIPVRHYGRWVSAVVVVGLVVLFVIAAASADIQYGVIGDYLTFDVVLKGLRHTLFISVAAQVTGIVLGVVFAVMRLSKNPVLSVISWLYIWFFRGTPVLVQLFFWFNLSLVVPTVLGRSTNDIMTPFVAALLGLGLNEGAYMAEIVRAGIISVDPGQAEASQALGMTGGMTMRRIVLPQAMRVIVPPTGNEFISMLKTSSLAFVVTYPELFEAARAVYTTNLLIIELLLVISIWYLVLTSIASWGQYYVERYFARGSRDLGETPLQRIRRAVTARPRL
jgi:polar amino acid transport system permease protein